MKDEPRPVFLLLADISGYTEFVRFHSMSASHAFETVRRLLGALIEASSPPLQVAEIEGDAVFFYALASPENTDEVGRAVRDQIPTLFRTFDSELSALTTVRSCPCDACALAPELRLKQIVHSEEASLSRIDRFVKLFGLDVILVHRMLKNSVPAREYLLMTEPAFDAFGGFFGQDAERRSEQLDGLGPVAARVVYSDQLREVAERGAFPGSPRSPVGTLAWKLGMQARTFLTAYRTRAPAVPRSDVGGDESS